MAEMTLELGAPSRPRDGRNGLFLPDFAANELPARRGRVESTLIIARIHHVCGSFSPWRRALPTAALAPLQRGQESVAVVNGHEIKTSEVDMAPRTFSASICPIRRAKLRYPFIVEYLVERHLLAQAAVKEGMAESEEYKRRLALYQAKALRDAYFATSHQADRHRRRDEEGL